MKKLIFLAVVVFVVIEGISNYGTSVINNHNAKLKKLSDI